MRKPPMSDDLFAREVARLRELQRTLGAGTRSGPLARRLQTASLHIMLWILREWWIVNAVVWLAVIAYSLLVLDGIDPPHRGDARRAP